MNFLAKHDTYTALLHPIYQEMSLYPFHKHQYFRQNDSSKFLQTLNAFYDHV